MESILTDKSAIGPKGLIHKILYAYDTNFVCYDYIQFIFLSLTGKVMSWRSGLLTPENDEMEHLVSERDCREGH